MITTRDLDWVSGIFEGEAWFGYGITTSRYKTKIYKYRVVLIRVNQRDCYILTRLQKLFGGNVQGGRIFQWSLTGEQARGLMMTVYFLMSPWRRLQIKDVLERWKKGSDV